MRVRTMLAPAIAAACLLAASASAASGAEPVWYRCAAVAKAGKHYTGAYANKHCTKRSTTHTGRYEVQPLAHALKFSGLGPGSPARFAPFESTWHIKGTLRELTLHCTGGTGEGEIVPPDSVAALTFTLTGCADRESELETRGEGSGKVVLGPLSGHLGWIDHEKGELGLELGSEAPGGSITAPNSVWRVVGETTGPRGVYGSMIALIPSSEGRVGRTFALELPVGPYLGMSKAGEICNAEPFEPITNIPRLEGGSESVLEIELGWECPSGIPIGWQASIKGVAEEELFVGE